ncbi:MAG: 2-oxo acid dehydrogenase subunit E2 [Spirochaetales bacterium]|nr:2-oxo acid dehydrogenase subunit E2 [Candidatus Physcosoma equi]
MGKKKKYSHQVKVPGINAIMAGIMPRRTEAELWLQDTIDITELMKYLEKKNEGKEKKDRITVFHCFLAALSKMVHERPKLNYYVKRYRTYERTDISFSFVVKQQMNDTAKEELMYYIPNLDGNIDDLKKDVLPRVRELRESKKGNGGVSGLFDLYTKFPRFLQALIMTAIHLMDYYQILPKALTKGDPDFSTILISNHGSIKSPSVYHHLNNYGNNSIMLNVGLIHQEKRLMENGNEEIRDIVDFGVTVDERIADGFYLSRSVKVLKYIFAHPELLDEPLGNPTGYDYR